MVKRSTALFFKQMKFNLLRESSEGYSALIVLLTSDKALSRDPTQENEGRRVERASRVLDRINVLIGHFDLSPPRVLDIIIEVAIMHVADHWRFFLELFRQSPWGVVERKEKTKRGLEAVEEAFEAKGNKILAQVLGAKFGFLQVSLIHDLADDRDGQQKTTCEA